MPLKHTFIKVINFTDNPNQQDFSLLTSEITLSRIPRLKFHNDSWQIGDKFMNFAVELISSTITSLISSGYITILDKEQKRIAALKITLWTKEKYLLRLQEKPRKSEFTGYLEDKIFQQFYISNTCYLDKIVYDTLYEIFNRNKNYINPGKALLIELIKNQKLNKIKSIQTTKWFSRHMTLTLDSSLSDNLKLHQGQADEFKSIDNEILVIRKTVKRQLSKFQNLN